MTPNPYQHLGATDTAVAVQEGIKAGSGFLHDLLEVFKPGSKTASTTNPQMPLVIQQPSSGMSGTAIAVMALGGIALLGVFALYLRSPRSPA